MRSRLTPPGTAKLQALAWLLLGLLAGGYLRLVVVCSGPCCPAHLTLAFAEKSCCSSHAEDGVCCGERAPATTRSSCCTGADPAPAEPADGERWHPARPCCASAPVDLAIGPLPQASAAPEFELSGPTPCAPKLAVFEPPRSVRAPRICLEGGEDPPPLARRREIVTTTLLRI
jgi:hypothetical protein